MGYKGKLKGFPKKVVDRMIQRQVEQGNSADVKVFEKFAEQPELYGGFTWSQTPEGEKFWRDVISHKKFYLVPDPSSPYPKLMLTGDSLDSCMTERVVVGEINGWYLCLDSGMSIYNFIKEQGGLVEIYKHVKEIDDNPVELTMDEIAKKFNIDVNKLKIKK